MKNLHIRYGNCVGAQDMVQFLCGRETGDARGKQGPIWVETVVIKFFFDAF